MRNLEPLDSLPVRLWSRDGTVVPRVDSVRILGLWIDARGCNGGAIERLGGQASNILSLISRITSKRGGLREDLLLTVFDAFFISHINYTVPYLQWTGTEKKKIDTIIRVGLKRILGIPQTTSTERLLELGLHNTVDELIEAHFAAQVARLSSTKAGLRILDEAGIAAPRVEVSDGVQLTRDEREDIMVDPIPRNIHPVQHVSRREARARAILRSIGSDAKAALFVDAAEYSTQRAFGVSVVDGRGQLVARASVCTDQLTVSEEVAIALAFQAAEVPCVVYSDSRSAVRAFSGGLISGGFLWRFDEQAAQLIRSGCRQARWDFIMVETAFVNTAKSLQAAFEVGLVPSGVDVGVAWAAVC
ncbi:hypothetical protein MTO96_047176 [Rhipicephalus appendiculatus]